MNPITQISQVLEKIAEYSNMDEAEKRLFIYNIYSGLIKNFLADSAVNISTETKLEFEKLDPNDEVILQELITKCLSQLSSTPQGQERLKHNLMQVLDTFLAPIIPSLTPTQKDEIAAILQPQTQL